MHSKSSDLKGLIKELLDWSLIKMVLQKSWNFSDLEVTSVNSQAVSYISKLFIKLAAIVSLFQSNF